MPLKETILNGGIGLKRINYGVFGLILVIFIIIRLVRVTLMLPINILFVVVIATC